MIWKMRVTDKIFKKCFLYGSRVFYTGPEFSIRVPSFLYGSWVFYTGPKFSVRVLSFLYGSRVFYTSIPWIPKVYHESRKYTMNPEQHSGIFSKNTIITLPFQILDKTIFLILILSMVWRDLIFWQTIILVKGKKTFPFLCFIHFISLSMHSVWFCF